MNKRGPKPRQLKSLVWSSDLAYVCGLIATDGSLSVDGRHINLTSKDLEQLETFKRCLGLKNKISWKKGGYTKQLCSQVQFGDVALYRWFVSIGIGPQKTKNIGAIKIPDKYFFDYLRGELDGDGSTHAYWDTRWRGSVCMYTNFISASLTHLEWLQDKISTLSGISGSQIRKGQRVFVLRYAKEASKQLIEKMYYSDSLPYLHRKKQKIDRQLQACSTKPPTQNKTKKGQIICIA